MEGVGVGVKVRLGGGGGERGWRVESPCCATCWYSEEVHGFTCQKFSH